MGNFGPLDDVLTIETLTSRPPGAETTPMRDRVLFHRPIPVTLAAFALAALMLAIGPRAAHAGTITAQDATLGYVPHEVLVGYRPGPVAAVTSDFELSHGIRTTGPPPAPHSELLSLPRQESVKSAARSSAP